MRRILLKVAFLGALLHLACPTKLNAQVLASVVGTEMSIGGGLWQYDYTVNNLLTPTTHPGYNLYDLSFGISNANATVGSVPNGWSYIQDSTTIDTYSGYPGPPPNGTDIAPRGSLSGFSFQFDSRVGSLPFTARFVNPTDPNNDLVYNGRTKLGSPPPPPGTKVLPAVATNRIGAYFPDNNQSQIDLLSGYRRNSAGNVIKSLVQFDLSSIPQGARVTSAKLTLFRDFPLNYTSINYQTGTSSNVYRVTRPWSETESTWLVSEQGTSWTTPGGDYTGVDGSLATPYAINRQYIPNTFGLVPVIWDVTSLVSDWEDGIYPNYGFMIDAEDQTVLSYHSLRANDPDLWPQLAITFTTTSVPEPSIGMFLGAICCTGVLSFCHRRRRKRFS